MIDGKPLADPSQYLPASQVPPSQGERAVKQMVDEAIAAHDIVIKAMHDDICSRAWSRSTRSSGGS
jgi:starvation-inducible DNA-binding protein